MALNTVDAKLLAKMFLAGAKNLENKKEWINELNVFPVPDGDTGTNMTMTIMAAAKEVAKMDDPDMTTLCKAMSSGSLRGARGNSGVILSQLLRGFTKVVREYDEVTLPVFAASFEKAVETAYKAVMKPKEGTILTVAKGISDKANELMETGCDDLEAFFAEVIKHGDYVLSQTPEMLPVLKQAGVVDSGGQGLMEVLKGAVDAFLGKEIDFSVETPTVSINTASVEDGFNEEDIKFGYCTEFIIMLNRPFNIKTEVDFKAYLESIGDSIVVVADDDIVKVHVHTNDPGMAIQKALMYGALSNMKIDNMRLEHQEKVIKMSEKAAAETQAPETSTASAPAVSSEPRKEIGFVTVAAGDGMTEIFKSLGVDVVISGGQTMNPSTDDIVNAINAVNADCVFVLPNNKNIILAANQAQYLVEDKKVVVIPTKTIAQGITAVINFVPDMAVEENEAVMVEEMGRVKTGEVTYAVRDTQIDDKEIRQGDYMGIGDKGILSVGPDMNTVIFEMVDEMVDDETELISVYYGEEVTEDAAEAIRATIADKYTSCDVELQYGGQPVYYYVISAE